MRSPSTWGIRSFVLVLASAVALDLPAAAQDPALTDLDRKVLVELTASRETPKATFHWRPGALDEKVVAEDVAANVAALNGLEKTLDLRYRGRVHVFLYADGAELKRLTDSDAVAFSTGTVSVHQPHDFRGVHEFVHIYALQFERAPDTAGPDLFTTEGLATWLAESDENVPIHAWAAADAKAGMVPSLLDLRRTFPSGVAAGVHPYHVAGSFIGFLLERYGLAKLKRWYMDSSEAHEYFGKGLVRLEREWREFLSEYELAPEHEKHVFARLGLTGEPLPAAWAKASTSALFDGKSLGGLTPEDAAKWRVQDGVLVGTNDAPWTHLTTTKSFGAAVGVRAKLRLVSGDAVKLRVNGSTEAIFARWSSYATGGGGNDRQKIPLGQWVELVVANDHGRGRVYLNGLTVFDLPGAWAGAGTGSLALAVEKGVLEVREWVAFEP